MNINEKTYQEDVEYLKSLPNVTATEFKDKNGIGTLFKSDADGALDVELRWWQNGGDFLAIDVDGVDCAYWHTGEVETLDYHIDLARAALLGRVAYNRSPFLRLEEVCFKIGDAWECTRTDRREWSFHYIKTRKKIKESYNDKPKQN